MWNLPFLVLSPLELIKLKFCSVAYYSSILIILSSLNYDLSSGDTFTDGSVRYTMTSMNVPEPVMSLAVSPVSKDSGGQVSGYCINNLICSVWICPGCLLVLLLSSQRILMLCT